MRITAAAPASMLDDANSFAMVMAYGPADAQTYRNPSWQDADSNLYAAASFEVDPEWVTAAQSTLERPAWDDPPEGEGYTVNMTGAERAQAALVFWAPDGETTPPQARPTALTAVAGMGGPEALVAMGLSRVEDDLP